MLHDLREIPTAGKSFGIIEVLAFDPGDFYLAGSRYMLCATAESDWDFYATYDPKLYERLIDHGFAPVTGYGPDEARSDYSGPDDASGEQTVSVMTLGNVHIQLLQDAVMMRAVRDRIMNTRLEEHIETKGKPERRQIWNQTIETLFKELAEAFYGEEPLELSL